MKSICASMLWLRRLLTSASGTGGANNSNNGQPTLEASMT